LIQAGADVNAANDHGVTPLALACTNGSAPLVRKLLDASANPDAATSMGETVLMTCAAAGNADAVKMLLDRGTRSINARESSRGQTALMWAVAYKHPDVVRVLIERGADIHARSTVSHLFVPTNAYASNLMGRETRNMPQGGFTPVLFAARQGDIESARLLLDAGANVNDTAADGISALVLAAHSGHTKLVAFLLDRGADVNAAEVGYTALHAAVLRGDMDMIKTLLAHKANPNARVTKGTRAPRDTNQWILSSYLAGATPFLLAAKYAEPTIMRLLVANGGDPLLPTNDGTTPLMMAAGMTWGWNMEDRRDRAVPNEVVDALHENEARTLEVVRLALELGGDVNAANAMGDTALHAATFKGFATVVKVLVDQGGDMSRKNKRGKVPELCYDRDKIVRCVTELGG
jgi:ankyrin